jgi:putative Holliday junction resolvase
MARLMALDVGEARIGVALSDAGESLASPYTTLHITRDETATWAAIQRLIAETDAQGLVVGLPISLDGEIHAQAERIMAFTERLKVHSSLPITFWDERFSTQEAERLLAEQGLNPQTRTRRRGEHSGRGRKQRARQQIDALAAAVILQGYLDHQRSQHALPQSTRLNQTEEDS